MAISFFWPANCPLLCRTRHLLTTLPLHGMGYSNQQAVSLVSQGASFGLRGTPRPGFSDACERTDSRYSFGPSLPPSSADRAGGLMSYNNFFPCKHLKDESEEDPRAYHPDGYGLHRRYPLPSLRHVRSECARAGGRG